MIEDEHIYIDFSKKLNYQDKEMIFFKILSDKRASNTFLKLLTYAEREEIYNEMHTGCPGYIEEGEEIPLQKKWKFSMNFLMMHEQTMRLQIY